MFKGKLFYSLGAMTKKALFLMREEGAWNKGKKEKEQSRCGCCNIEMEDVPEVLWFFGVDF